MIKSQRLTRQSLVYKLSSTATNEIFESNNFFTNYFLRDNETNLGKYGIIIESKKNKKNYWNITCNTKNEIKNFINDKTDIKIV